MSIVFFMIYLIKEAKKRGQLTKYCIYNKTTNTTLNAYKIPFQDLYLYLNL